MRGDRVKLSSERMLELANKLEARFTLILGDNELVSKSYTLKNMTTGDQETLSRPGLIERLRAAVQI